MSHNDSPDKSLPNAVTDAMLEALTPISPSADCAHVY